MRSARDASKARAGGTIIDTLAGELHERSRNGLHMVGIVGLPGSGKSTLARALCERVNDAFGPSSAFYMPMDGFHLSNQQLREQGKSDRKGAPDTFDVWGIVNLLQRIRLSVPGRPIYAPDYSRELHEPVAGALRYAAPTPLVIVEGNYLSQPGTGWVSARELLDELWYIDVAPSVQRQRLVDRQIAGGRSLEAAEEWFEQVDVPNSEKIAATRSQCSRILNAADLLIG